MPFSAEQAFQGRTIMKRFRFFLIDSMGRIDRGLEKEFRDATEALRFAKQQTDATSVEVWQERTMIAKLKPLTA